jgi:hypothetical protein
MKEAELLSERIAKTEVTAFYCSPLGRAKDTAKPTLERLGREATVLDWLREFPVSIEYPEAGVSGCSWDWLPHFWTSESDFYDRKKWMDVPIFKEANMREAYQKVSDGLDALLASHGYQRENGYYRVAFFVKSRFYKSGGVYSHCQKALLGKFFYNVSSLRQDKIQNSAIQKRELFFVMKYYFGQRRAVKFAILKENTVTKSCP